MYPTQMYLTFLTFARQLLYRTFVDNICKYFKPGYLLQEICMDQGYCPFLQLEFTLCI